MAKNVYVWLHQLSRKYRRSIYRLDQIPDEELTLLARWGFTGLWLIGVWERSLASKRIKELLGDPDAVASAYSLFDYQIASDLGGEEAFQDLKDRAWRRGIRMASDMVPNHVGMNIRSGSFPWTTVLSLLTVSMDQTSLGMERWGSILKIIISTGVMQPWSLKGWTGELATKGSSIMETTEPECPGMIPPS
jgi:hypothetical protein